MIVMTIGNIPLAQYIYMVVTLECCHNKHEGVIDRVYSIYAKPTIPC